MGIDGELRLEPRHFGKIILGRKPMEIDQQVDKSDVSTYYCGYSLFMAVQPSCSQSCHFLYVSSGMVTRFRLKKGFKKKGPLILRELLACENEHLQE